MAKTTKRLLGTLLLSLLAVTGCAKKPANNDDPFEGYNRVMFATNMTIDHLLIRPVAKVYNVVTPPVIQTGVKNVFDNIDEISTVPNDVLQGNFKYLAVDFWRFVLNTTLGVGGLFDVATKIGIQPHIETFGLTLAKWRGGKLSPYIVLPLFGPSTIQNAIGFTADYYMTPWPYLKDQNINYIAHGVKFLNIRASYLDGDKLVETSFDPYIFVRDAYMQKQRQKITNNEALGKKAQ
ncbi:MAG TPA: VacJ family lipoprotein [Coxiellaceae bacterium]|nr:VacJ family lipoprotein [Coxiellaceae bacterium]